MFLTVGSLLGLLSVSGLGFSTFIAEALGVSGSRDLFLYLGLMTIFIFVFVTWERHKNLEDKITKLSIEISLNQAKE
jgi:hypothetical protein